MLKTRYYRYTAEQIINYITGIRSAGYAVGYVEDFYVKTLNISIAEKTDDGDYAMVADIPLYGSPLLLEHFSKQPAIVSPDMAMRVKMEEMDISHLVDVCRKQDDGSILIVIGFFHDNDLYFNSVMYLADELDLDSVDRAADILVDHITEKPEMLLNIDIRRYILTLLSDTTA